MKKIITVLFFVSSFVLGQNAWINEFHYDNASTDVGEFIEVAIENAGDYSLSDFTITLYNGNGGAKYDVHTLNSFTVGITENNITLYYKNISGIQNGAPDGFALDYQSSVIQFLSYEGTFTATDGVASGITSVDIGVSETSSTPVGSSLGLTGDGTIYSSFTWTSFSDDTPGASNGSQALPVELTTFTAAIIDQNVELNWETAIEINNYGFEIERASTSSATGKSWETLGFVEGHGNSNSPKFYSYTDNTIEASGQYQYRLKQIDIDGTFEYSDVVEANLGAPESFELDQNYPNPFNPTTSIRFNLPMDSNVKLTVFNVLGQEVAELINENITAGYHSVNFDGSSLNSGIYFYQLETNDFTQIRKMMLVK